MTIDVKPKVFISHIHEEAQLGGVLKSWIEDAFPGQLTVFLSSDPRDLPGGSKWLEVVRSQLKDESLKILISLISPSSLSRPWISIELGAAWIRDCVVMPLCHSGVKNSSLPRPLADFMANELEKDGSAKSLMDAIAKELKLRYSPRLAFADMQAEVTAACAGVVYTPQDLRNAPQSLPVIEDAQILILQLLCTSKDFDGDGEVSLMTLSATMEIPASRLEVHFQKLIAINAVKELYYYDTRHFSITETGTALLIKLNKHPN